MNRFAENNESFPYEPSSGLFVPNADISLCLISQGSLAYQEPVHDPLFVTDTTNSAPSGFSPAFYGRNAFNTVVCIDQVQYCNANNHICTNLTYPEDAYLEAIASLDLNEDQVLVAGHLGIIVGFINTPIMGFGLLGPLGE